MCNSLSKHSRPHVSTEKAERCQTGYLVLKTILKESMIISPLHMEKQMLYLVMQTAIGQVEFWPHALHYIHTHCMGGHPPCELTPVVYFFFFFYLISVFFFFFFVVDFVIHWNETAMGLHVFPIPIPAPTSLSTRSLQVFPEHQVRALVSCIQPGLVICFTLDNIHVSMLFSWTRLTS